ncbi:B12-binding domain-containing radical SAM protein [Sedimentibacter sp.]|uniref:B12-binding domain-containing radical SAM protein n=1 Tax=Sedimentibacter sp. TaxID=1960295 RepID=UPI000EC0DF37|nr:radical SAM protein [Sedimentibacter sp.]HCX60999.1 B12-binding domain-containing radical SAM protein [Clostridiales bacterium]
MKLLLVRPKSLNLISNVNVIDLEPLDLEYLYTIAKEENVDCRIFDALHDNRKLKDILINFQPDIVAVSGYITQEQVMIDCSKIVKEYNPSIKVMVGGVHVEINFERFYTDNIDYIMHSSSLEPFKRILKLGVDFDIKELESIDGICYRKNTEWIENRKLLADPNDLPIPDRSHFNENKHLYRYLGYSPCAIVKTAYSCPYECSFCFCRKINGGKYIARDINLVVDEIEGIECDNIHIVDDTFLVNKQRVNTFISLIKERNIKKNFVIYSRADFVVENEEIIKELGSAGVVGIIVGLEAIDDNTLNSYSKQSSKNANEECVRILKKHDIDCLALFIVDMQATKEDFAKLYNWIEQAELKYASVSIFTPIPGTQLYEEYKDKLTTDKIHYWDFIHLVLKPTNLTKQEYYMEYYKLIVKLTLLGKKHGVYDFVDLQYIRDTARNFFASLMEE